MLRFKNVLKNKDGFSELISSIVGLFVMLCMLLICITYLRVVNQQLILNEFATQMMYAVCDYGTTDSTDIDDRYSQLEDSLNMSPIITYDTSYFDSSNSTVQYGDLITLTATSTAEINLLGFTDTLVFEITKTGRSEEYWK